MEQESDLSIALAEIHKQIANDIKDYEKDEEIAKQLEDYFNYLNKKDSEEQNTFDKLLKEMATNEIIGSLKEKYIKQKKVIEGNIGMPNWKKFELKISAMVTDLVSQIDGTKLSYASKNKGTTLSYVDLSDIPEEILKELLKSKYLQVTQDKETGFFRTIKKQQKNDVVINVNTEFPLGDNLTFSVKNYSGKIKLEKVNTLKAYIAAMKYLMHHQKNLNINNRQMYQNFYDYYTKKSIPDDSEGVTMHLNHIIYIYGLTGLGSQLNAKNFTQTTRFLVENTGYNIKVYSTKSIINDLLSGANERYEFFSSDSLKGSSDLSMRYFRAKKKLTK